MLKEYRFRLNYEYYSFEDSPKEYYYVNGHKINKDLYCYLFRKVCKSIPIDTYTEFIWENHKTGSHARTKYWTFN